MEAAFHLRPAGDELRKARVLMADARARGIALKLMGGFGILCRCPSAGRPPLARDYQDVDFAGSSRESRQLIELFTEAGYIPERRFNSLHGHRRLLFKEEGGHVDVLLDHFEMCHKIDLTDRLDLDEESLPLADLLLTKMQVVQVNAKDLTDALALLVDHPVGEGPEVIDAGYIARLCASDWGLQETLSLSCDTLLAYAEDIGLEGRDLVGRRLAALRSRMEQEPKTMRWKARAKIGTRKRWYELPEEVH